MRMETAILVSFCNILISSSGVYLVNEIYPIKKSQQAVSSCYVQGSDKHGVTMLY